MSMYKRLLPLSCTLLLGAMAAGEARSFREHRDILDQAKAERRSPIKLSGTPPKPASLHVALFQGLYSKALAFCMERQRLHVHMEVRTDRVDLPIFENFEAAAQDLLDYGADIKRVTGFDTTSKKIAEGHIIVGETPEEIQLPIVIEHLELKIVDDRDGVVVAADVLANSLNHRFTNRSDREQYGDLNTLEAIEGHPLQQHLDSFWNWGSYNFTDTYYAHPLHPRIARGSPTTG